MESVIFFLNKGGVKLSCIKIFLWSIVAQKGTNILTFYIFEYDAEYDAECSAESGVKQYFMVYYDKNVKKISVALLTQVET